MSQTQTPIDLTVAYRIARGRNQKRWLQQMLSPAGLDLDECAYGTSAWKARTRSEAFVDNFACAGYAIQDVQIDPGEFPRTFITGYVPAAVPLLAAIRGKGGFAVRYQTVRLCELLAWVEHAAPEVVDAAAAIVPWFTGSLEDLLAVAPGIAQRPGR